MMITISEFENNLDKYLELSAEKDVYITKDGRIIAKLTIPFENREDIAKSLFDELRVSEVRPMQNYQLWVQFNNGEEKIFDFKPLLDAPVYAPLKDVTLFETVYIDYGCPVWDDGRIDIAPEYLYKHGMG